MEMYDNQNTLEKSFNLDFITEDLIQAQWAEFIELKKVISETFLEKGKPITILDIGIGNGRIAKHLSNIEEMWEMIALYDGIDNAEGCVNLSKSLANEQKISDKLFVQKLDATQLHLIEKTYDLVICTWFTPGNFFPENFPFDNYISNEKEWKMKENPKFTSIFQSAYDKLNEGGKIILGAVYLEGETARIKQEKLYNQMGMQVITSQLESFTATKERFWSQRFSPEKIYNYLPFVQQNQIKTIPLDPYNFAVQIHITKNKK